MKRFFRNPKNAALLVIGLAAAITMIGTVTVKSALISKEEAMNAALSDAGLSESEASALRARLEFDDGRFQYEVDFYNNGTEYEYTIQAKDGDIIARDMEGGAVVSNQGQNLPQNAKHQPVADAGSSAQAEIGDQPAADTDSSAQPESISLDEAKAAALNDAGLSESDVTFKKTETDHDHGMTVYDIEFYTSDAEYDYEISASDGTVLEKNTERFHTPHNPAGHTADSHDSYIGADRAKEIALNHAALNESDVRITKAELDHDDGTAEYEIEFYSGRTEYDYTIDAVSGNIIEYDVDYD